MRTEKRFELACSDGGGTLYRTMIGLLVFAFILADVLVIGAILSIVFRRIWQPWVEKYPPQAVTEPSHTRKFQSFAVGQMNLGGCVHVTLDDRFLHLQPARPLHGLGLKPISIPWEAIQLDDSAATWSTASAPSRSFGSTARKSSAPPGF